MIHLDALKCSKCGDQCDSVFIDETIYEVMCCQLCGKLYCGVCSQYACIYCAEDLSEYCLLSACKHISDICSLVKYAPADELQLIDLQPCLNLTCCTICGLSSSPMYRCGTQQIVCEMCCKYHFELHSTTGKTDDRFREIIRELSATSKKRSHYDGFPQATRQTSNKGEITEQTPIIKENLPVEVSMHCNSCGNTYEEENEGLLSTTIVDGEPYCSDCSKRLTLDNRFSNPCYCLRKLFAFIRCIPENQLHKLTYSKWINAIGCVQHQQILYDLNAVSADGLKKDKLCSFFKKEDIVGTSNSSKTSKNTKSALSKLDPSIPEKLLPDRITCSCGREDELSNMFDCLTCSTYGVCALCLAKQHWGHEMNESKKTVASFLINSQSEATRQKLVEMFGQANCSNKAGEKSFEKLCHALGVVFKDAMLSEDLHRIQSLLTKANTSELEKYFKNATNSSTKLYKYIDSFCEDLLEAVEEEKQNTSVCVKEPSSTSRE